MTAFALRPSPLIGQIMRALEAGVATGEIQAYQPVEFYVDLLKRDPTRFGLA